VTEYTDAERNITAATAAPFAYPAYDNYNVGHNDPTVLSDADLLAPQLLNVKVTLRSYYGLQAIRDELEDALADPNLVTPLEDLDEETACDLASRLYAVLDGPSKPWGVEGTTLSKVLHRKRPASIALHDRWVRACYLGTGGARRSRFGYSPLSP
jgi:hypothetical protein